MLRVAKKKCVSAAAITDCKLQPREDRSWHEMLPPRLSRGC